MTVSLFHFPSNFSSTFFYLNIKIYPHYDPHSSLKLQP